MQGALTFAVVTSLGAYAMLMGIGLLYARTGELGMHPDRPGPGRARPPRRPGTRRVRPGHDRSAGQGGRRPVPLLAARRARRRPHAGVHAAVGCHGRTRRLSVSGASTGRSSPGPGGSRHPPSSGRCWRWARSRPCIGAVMCWHQRHIKRLLAYSTVAHTGLFLIGIGVLTPEADDGIALYVLGARRSEGGPVRVRRHPPGPVRQRRRARPARQGPRTRGVAVLFVPAGPRPRGLPPFGTALGKSVTEEAVGGPLTVLYVAGLAR